MTAPAPSVAVSPAPTGPRVAALTKGQLRAALTAVMMAIMLGALDQTIVSVAAPSVARQLGGFEWLAWVLSGYLIASTVVTPLYGRFSDQFGRPRMMRLALWLFIAASVGCALARDMPQLVGMRVLQGLGGGGLIVLAQALIADLVAPRERGKYQSYVSLVWAVASLVGPVIGGLLTQYLAWQWIFWINLPLGLLTLLLVRRSLATLPVERRVVRVDVTGAVLLLVGLVAGLVPITRVGQGVPWTDPGNLAGGLLCVLLLALFTLQERRHPQPILPLALLRQGAVLPCALTLFICYAVFIAMSVLVPLRLQLSAGLASGAAALHLLPLTLAIPAAAFIAGRWVYRTGRVRPPLQAGIAMVPVALFALGAVPPTGAAGLCALVLLGVGVGLQLPTSLLTVQYSVPQADLGAATGLVAFFRLLGGAIGIAVFGSLILALLRTALPGGSGSTGALAGGAPAGLGALMDLARAQPGGLPGGAGDTAFRQLLWLAAAFTLVPWAVALRLPDVRMGQPGGVRG
jgi:EmrB/QacA subfamily drug resistance transporter